MKDLSIYIHIPFCDHKCIYCDFYSIVNYRHTDDYLEAIITEIKNGGSRYSGGRIVKSVFFGGGTPSFMAPEYIGKIISTLRDNFQFADDCEVTLETNPGTVTGDKLSGFKDAGINRISIGIQSFDDEELKFLTRIHSSETAQETVKLAAASGFEDISIDLIFNLPGQTKEMWLKNLNTAVSLPITHISAYSLILEKGTILNKMVLDGKVNMQDADYDAELYSETIKFFTAEGFGQYEVSNFAKPGNECYHNNIYWNYGEYLGFGTSAHSFMEGRRFWNYSSLTFYLEAIKNKNNAEAGFEVLTNHQKKEEYIMLTLRSSGIDKTALPPFFNIRDFEYIKNRIELLNIKEYFNITENKISLNPSGYAVGDEIITELLIDE